MQMYYHMVKEIKRCLWIVAVQYLDPVSFLQDIYIYKFDVYNAYGDCMSCEWTCYT